MDGREEKIFHALQGSEEEKGYPCVWYESLLCPIRTRWKLTPENLKGWCDICQAYGYLKELKNKAENIEVKRNAGD